MARGRPRAAQGLTLVELMIVVAVVAVLVLLAAPSFRDMILMQRLRGVNAQLVTDLQFARSEAVQRQTIVRFVFSNDGSRTCYAIFTSRQGNGERCNCLLGPGSACSSVNVAEVRTVVVPRDLGVTVLPTPDTVEAFGFSPITGGLIAIPSDSDLNPPTEALIEARVDDPRRLRVALSQAGRPSVCAPDADTMQVSACP